MKTPGTAIRMTAHALPPGRDLWHTPTGCRAAGGLCAACVCAQVGEICPNERVNTFSLLAIFASRHYNKSQSNTLRLRKKARVLRVQRAGGGCEPAARGSWLPLSERPATSRRGAPPTARFESARKTGKPGGTAEVLRPRQGQGQEAFLFRVCF